MSNCENCGMEEVGDFPHLLSECFISMHDRVEQLEEVKRGLTREVALLQAENKALKARIESFKRLLKTNAVVPPHPV